MLKGFGAKSTDGVNHLFHKRGRAGKMIIIVAKAVNDLVIRGMKSAMNHFATLQNDFFTPEKIGKTSKTNFVDCQIP